MLEPSKQIFYKCVHGGIIICLMASCCVPSPRESFYGVKEATVTAVGILGVELRDMGVNKINLLISPAFSNEGIIISTSWCG